MRKPPLKPPPNKGTTHNKSVGSSRGKAIRRKWLVESSAEKEKQSEPHTKHSSRADSDGKREKEWGKTKNFHKSINLHAFNWQANEELIEAAKSGDVNKVRKALDRGADVNIKVKSKKTPKSIRRPLLFSFPTTHRVRCKTSPPPFPRVPGVGKNKAKAREIFLNKKEELKRHPPKGPTS